jgi:K+-transporting ATPase A subunit
MSTRWFAQSTHGGVVSAVSALAMPATVLLPASIMYIYGRMVGNTRRSWRNASATRLSTEGSVPTDTSLFGIVLIGRVIVVGAITFLPALALGPLAEQAGLVSALPMVAR